MQFLKPHTGSLEFYEPHWLGMAAKKGKKKSKGDADKSSEQPSEREIAARVELEKLNDELASVKSEVSLSGRLRGLV